MEAELVVLAGDSAGQRFVVRPAQRLLLGRTPIVPIAVIDSEVSRRHALVELRPDEGLFVTDLDSKNGTRVGSRLLIPNFPTRVLSGERIEVGGSLLEVGIKGDDDETRRMREARLRADGPVLDPAEFEILGAMGEGGGGRIYAVKQRQTNRVVAIKILRDEKHDDVHVERFLREGRVACRLDSPNLVKVFEARSDRGRLYLVMELIDGLSARDRLRSGPLAVPEALSIAEDVARGLAVVHDAGVIHRDVKPSNILLSPDGVAKLGDFGIAKDLNSSVPLTDPGQAIGTLSYMSPEQIDMPEAIDSRADIYGLGATLYHLIAGRPPFPAGCSRPAMRRVLEDPPPPLEKLRPDCPLFVAAFVHELLAKNRADRPAPTLQVASRLHALLVRHYPGFAGGMYPSKSRTDSHVRLPLPSLDEEATEDRREGAATSPTP